jgi:hypothetical protein
MQKRDIFYASFFKILAIIQLKILILFSLFGFKHSKTCKKIQKHTHIIFTS